MKLRLLALLLATVAGCRALPEHAYPSGGPSAAPEPDAAATYALAPGDRLDVRFPTYPQWNAEVLVRDDGLATIPLVGDLAVAGTGVAALREQVEAALQQRIRSPRVEIALRETHAREIFVGGEVVTPGRLTLTAPTMSLDQAVFAAGGPRRDTARLDKVVLLRTCTDGVRRAWWVDLDAMLADTAAAAPVRVLPGDVVFVPNSRIDEVNLFVSQYLDRMVPAQNLVGTGVVLGAARR